jgi:hypothetical protein
MMRLPVGSSTGVALIIFRIIGNLFWNVKVMVSWLLQGNSEIQFVFREFL